MLVRPRQGSKGSQKLAVYSTKISLLDLLLSGGVLKYPYADIIAYDLNLAIRNYENTWCGGHFEFEKAVVYTDHVRQVLSAELRK